MLPAYSLRSEVCVQSHNLLREIPLKFVEDDSNNKCVVVRDGVEKRFEGSEGAVKEGRKNKRGSGGHWLRPVIRAIASEPRRSLAIRAPAAA